MRQLSLFPPTATIANGRLIGSLPSTAPIVVSNGVGVDSVALLIKLQQHGLIPDLIITALVGQETYGNEHRRFYDYLPILEDWLAQVGFPPITYVWYEMKRAARYFEYWSLAGNCLANRTLPSISFRRNHSCSLKYKGHEIDRLVTARYGSLPCYRLVGYDATEGYRAARFAVKSKPNSPRQNDSYLYPLQLWGMDRAACETVIASAGLPSPGLSACVFCAASKPAELDDLLPEELWLIVILEAHAQINLQQIRGLWGHGERMTEYIRRRELLPVPLLDAVWAKWAARERPPELRHNPTAVADEILFAEIERLVALTNGNSPPPPQPPITRIPTDALQRSKTSGA